MSASRGYFAKGDFDPRNEIPHPTRDDSYKLSVTIDSNDRDKTIYADSNSFTVDLPTEVKNVMSVELRGWNPPKTEYNVHTGNNKIDFYNGNVDTATVISGGSGYTDGTVDVVLTGTSNDAKATIAVSDGAVTALTITTPGTGYTNGETVTVGTGGATATIKLVEYTATLREGQYTIGGNPNDGHTSNDLPSGLIKEIEYQMNAVSGVSGIEVRLVSEYADTDTDTNACMANRIQISSTNPDALVLLFATGSNAGSSARSVLGFSATDHDSTQITKNYKGTTLATPPGVGEEHLRYACQAQYDYNLHDYPKCIIMDLEIDRQKLRRVKSNSPHINDKFAVIYLDTNPPNVLGDLGVGFDTVAIGSSVAETTSMMGSIKNGTNRYLSGPQGKYQRHALDSSSVSALTGYSGSGAVKPIKGTDINAKYVKFNPPINVRKFKCSFYKNNGILYDFKGQDHKLEFELLCKF